MSTPRVPLLKESSAERMAEAVERADAEVDAGRLGPDEALAKAARELALPTGHVPLVVRAFNTARAVRQLGEAGPWEKAAAHPVADARRVLELLADPGPSKQAGSLADYTLPPTVTLGGAAVPVPKPDEEEDEDDPKAPSGPAKSASAPKPAYHTRLSAGYEAAAAYDLAADHCGRLAPAGYAAVKAAALRRYPAAAGYFFGRLEAEDPWTARLAAKAAAAVPDPTITADHPVVGALAVLGRAKAAYEAAVARPPLPEGAVVLRDEGERVWYLDGPPLPVKEAALIPGLGVEDPCDCAEPAPKGVELEASPAAGRKAPRTQVDDREEDVLPEVGGGLKLAGFGAGLGSGLAKGWETTKTVGKAWQLAEPFKREPEGGPKGPPPVAQQFRGDLDRVDEQAAVQDLLADPRFHKVDPRLVLNAYRQLSSLAPGAMRNPAVAGDFVHRQLQTGPPSYFDLKALTDIEKNLAHSRQVRSEEDD